MTLPPIGANAELNLDRWTRNVQQMTRDAQNSDAALQSIVDAANKAEASINAINGDVDVRVDVDDSEIEAAVGLQDLLAQNTSFVASADEGDIESAVDLQAALDENTAFVAGVDGAEIDAALRMHSDLETNVAFSVNVDGAEIDAAKRDHDDLEQNTSFTARVNDSEIDTAKRKHDDLEANTSFRAGVDDSEVESLLSDIKALETIQIAISVAQPAVDFIKGVGELSVGSLFEMDTAMAQLEGTTGRMIPGAEKLIRDLYVNAWGESRTEISKVIGLADQLGISQQDMAVAVESAFQAAVVMGADVNETLRTMDRLVKLGLVPSYDAAADVIIAGFQEGGNRADDLLETLDEYGSTFKDLGLDGEQAMNILVNAMDEGFKNTDLAADALREFNIRVRDLNDAAAQDAIKRLGIQDAADDFRDGTLAGDEFLTLVIDKLKLMDDPVQRQITAVELFGTQLEDIGTNAINGLDPAIDRLGDVSDRAEDASDAFYNDLPTALTRLKRFAEEEIAGFLNEAFDIEGAIDDAKLNMQTFFDEMQSGTGIFEALEISFGIGGLEETMQTLQRTFADVGLAFLEAIRAVLSLFDKDAAKSVEGFIADLSEVQLGADIFAADSQEEVVSAIKRALDRGADEAEIGQKIVDHVRALQDSGDLQGALEFVDMINTDVGIFNVDMLRGQIIQEMNAAVNSALDSGDLRTAFELAPTVEIRQTFADQMKTDILRLLDEPFKSFSERQDLINFTQILSNSTGSIDFEALKTNVGEAGATEIVEGLRAGFADAVNSGQFALAMDYAELLGEQNLIDTVDVLIGEMDRLGDPRVLTATEALNTDIVGLFAVVDDTTTNIAESGEDIGGTFEELSEDSRSVRKNVETEVQGMGKAINVEAGNIGRHGRDMSKTFSDVDRDAGSMNKGASLEFRSMSGDFEDTALDIGASGEQIDLVFAGITEAAGLMNKGVSLELSGMTEATQAMDTEVAGLMESVSASFVTGSQDIGVSLDAILADVQTFTKGSNDVFLTLEKTTGRVVDNVTGDFIDLSATATTLGEQIGTAVQRAEDEFEEFGVIWHNRTLVMGDEYSAFVDRMQIDSDRLIQTLLEAQRQAQNIDLTPRSGSVGTGGGSTGGGGRGFMETDAAMLHAGDFVSSSSVSNASSSVTNIDVDYNFFTNSTAQDLGAVGNTASQLRGFN